MMEQHVPVTHPMQYAQEGSLDQHTKEMREEMITQHVRVMHPMRNTQEGSSNNSLNEAYFIWDR